MVKSLTDVITSSTKTNKPHLPRTVGRSPLFNPTDPTGTKPPRAARRSVSLSPGLLRGPFSGDTSRSHGHRSTLGAAGRESFLGRAEGAEGPRCQKGDDVPVGK